MDDKTQLAILKRIISGIRAKGIISGILFGVVIAVILGVTTGNWGIGISGGASMAVAGAIGFSNLNLSCSLSSSLKIQLRRKK